MMGQQAGTQDQLFYSFNLDLHVPSDHLLRGIDRFLDYCPSPNKAQLRVM